MDAYSSKKASLHISRRSLNTSLSLNFQTPFHHNAAPILHHTSLQNVPHFLSTLKERIASCMLTPATRGNLSQAPSAAFDTSCSAYPALPSSLSSPSTDEDRFANPGSCSASPQSSCPTPCHAHLALRNSGGRQYPLCRVSSSPHHAPPLTLISQTESSTLPHDALTRSGSSRSGRSAD